MNIEKIKENINKAIKEKQEHRERTYLYTSDIYQCQRKIWHEFQGEKADFTPRTLRIFDNGNAVHERVGEYFKNAGMYVGEEIDIPHGKSGVHGRLDLLLEIDGEKVIGEIKSINLDEVTSPKREHKAQLMYYMYMMNIHKGILIYESKRNQELFIFEVKYDIKKVQKILEWYEETRKKCSYKRPPAKKHKDYYPCKFGAKGYCPFYELCHGEK